MRVDAFDGARVLILGYAVEGISTHRYLVERRRPSFIGIADRRDVTPRYRADAVFTAGGSLAHLQEFDIVVRSPGVPAFDEHLVAAGTAGVAITSQTNLLLSGWGPQTIGVTGTKGKSTTASLLAAILGQAGRDVRLVGNIGTPPLDEVPSVEAGTVFVAELSSYQLEDAIASPRFAVLLGLRSEHLDRHGSFEAYVAAKAHIFSEQGPEGVLVYDLDTPANREVASAAPGIAVGYSLTDPIASAHVEGEAGGDAVVAVVRGRRRRVMPVADIPLLGTGNIRNVLAATAMATQLDVSADDIAAAVRSFRGLPHRIEFVGERGGVRFYDDSIATIPEAAINALEALGDDVQTLIAGGHDRGIDYTGFGAWLAAHPRVETIILFPPAGDRIAEALRAALARSDSRNVEFVDSMAEAADIAFARTSPGRVCLLSPAAASFGTFIDYRDRGHQFRRSLGLDAPAPDAR